LIAPGGSLAAEAPGEREHAPMIVPSALETAAMLDFCNNSRRERP
jgi:hypothetical protein